MIIRAYQTRDCQALAELFYTTVHTINARDYTQAQLDAWADGAVDLIKWDQSFQAHKTFVAVIGSTIVGFGDIDQTGYLDRLFVHAAYQRQGIATALCDALEATVAMPIVTHASITAKAFFTNRGYRVIKAQQVERRGVYLTNYVMEKQRDEGYLR